AQHDRDCMAVQQLREQVAHGPGRVWSRPVLRLAWAELAALVRAQGTRQVYWASIAWLFWPAYAFAMAAATLPLFVGLLIPSVGAAGVGAVYAVGIRLGSEWVPLADTWMYALGTAVSLLVLLVYLALAVEPPGLFSGDGQPHAARWHRSFWTRATMAAFVAVFLGGATAIPAVSYGWGWALLGIGRMWLLVASCMALYIVDWRPAAHEPALLATHAS
ncbi:hypothetical protein IWQ56_007031, partial [Coemansia nantahalensis]